MKLKVVTDAVLLQDLKTFVAEEKRLIKTVIEYLEEVERRRLYAEQGYSSMFAFCTGFLNYTPQEAQTRIQAMRLGQQVPEIKNLIQNGSISLCVAAKVQSHIIKENRSNKDSKVPAEYSKQMISAVEGKSVRESEKILLGFFPHHGPNLPNKVRRSGENTIRLEVNLTEEVFEKLELIKNLRSHVNPSGDWELLLNDLCELGLKKWDPMKRRLN